MKEIENGREKMGRARAVGMDGGILEFRFRIYNTRPTFCSRIPRYLTLVDIVL